MNILWQLARTEPFLLVLLAAIVFAIVSLVVSMLVEEARRYRAFRKHLEERLAEEEAKAGIKPVAALPWYYNPAVSGVLVGFSKAFGLIARVSGFFKRLGNFLLALLKRGMGRISSSLKNWEESGKATRRKWGEEGQWGKRLLLYTKVAGLLLLALVAMVTFLLLAVLCVPLWLLVQIPAAIAWAFSAASGWLGQRASWIKRKMAEQEEIRSIRQKEQLVPDGIIFYHQSENSARTGKVYKGFLPKEAIDAKENAAAALPTKLVLLINGTGYWFERPERLRLHTVNLVAEELKKFLPIPSEVEKKGEIRYDEAEIFRGLSAAGAIFKWRSSKWQLLDSGDCEVELHGAHPHFRSVSLVPFEKVRYWLAIMEAEEGEKKEGPNEVLLVEEILGSWGEHKGLLRIFAWTGIELPKGEVEEARVFLSSFNPEEIRVAIPAYVP